jgi:hypothetical protein
MAQTPPRRTACLLYEITSNPQRLQQGLLRGQLDRVSLVYGDHWSPVVKRLFYSVCESYAPLPLAQWVQWILLVREPALQKWFALQCDVELLTVCLPFINDLVFTHLSGYYEPDKVMDTIASTTDLISRLIRTRALKSMDLFFLKPQYATKLEAVYSQLQRHLETLLQVKSQTDSDIGAHVSPKQSEDRAKRTPCPPELGTPLLEWAKHLVPKMEGDSPFDPEHPPETITLGYALDLAHMVRNGIRIQYHEHLARLQETHPLHVSGASPMARARASYGSIRDWKQDPLTRLVSEAKPWTEHWGQMKAVLAPLADQSLRNRHHVDLWTTVMDTLPCPPMGCAFLLWLIALATEPWLQEWFRRSTRYPLADDWLRALPLLIAVVESRAPSLEKGMAWIRHLVLSECEWAWTATYVSTPLPVAYPAAPFSSYFPSLPEWTALPYTLTNHPHLLP